MEEKTSTYREIYEGKRVIPGRPPIVEYEAVYYLEEEENTPEISLEITRTHKLAQDLPTVTWRIPLSMLSLTEQDAAPVAADFCLRAFLPYLDELNDELFNRSRPDNENGKYYLCRPGGEILVRNTAYFAPHPQRDYTYRGGNVIVYTEKSAAPPVLCLCIRMQVQFPKGKLKKAFRMLCSDLPKAVKRFAEEFPALLPALEEALALSRTQNAIRRFLRESEYCAFLANGSILPRKGDSDLPLPDAVPFLSPPGDEIEVAGVRGMGIKRGVTVITGGGYSGKSTLLDAISAGIYDHIPGDGRELCITDETAVTICAEDGRSVRHVNISPFLRFLPGGDPACFSTNRASGSTSQAANILEAVDTGARLLLIDEDRSATNFMIRDDRMKRLIQKEPIIPFTDRAKELAREKGVSTILVIGGSGEYLSVADRVYCMDKYRISDVTKQARALCEDGREPSAVSAAPVPPEPADWTISRRLLGEQFSPYPTGSGSEKLEVFELGIIFIGDEQLDLRGLHSIVTPRQLDAIGFLLRYLEVSHPGGNVDLPKIVDELYAKIEKEGLDCVYSSVFTTCRRFLDLPRKCDLLLAIYRMRELHWVGKR